MTPGSTLELRSHGAGSTLTIRPDYEPRPRASGRAYVRFASRDAARLELMFAGGGAGRSPRCGRPPVVPSRSSSS